MNRMMRTAKRLVLGIGLALALAAQPVMAAGGSVTANLSATSPVSCGGTTQVTLTIDGQSPPPSQQPVDVMLVLDKSGSMSLGGAMTALKNAANNFVNTMDNSDGALDGNITASRVGMVAFDSTASLKAALTHNAAAVKNQINLLSPFGGTNIAAGISVGQNNLGIAPPKKVMILMTDGQAPDATAQANAAKAAGTEIFTIGLGPNVDPRLASYASSPAHHFNAPSPSDLENIFQAIAFSVAGPAATNLSYDVQAAPGFEVVAAAATAGTVAGVSPSGFTWTMAELRTESLTITYTLQHTGSVNGMVPIHQMADLNWTDDDGNLQSVSYAGAQVEVTGCNNPPTADAGPDQVVAMDLSGYATVTLDGSGSTDDGQIAPLTYDWYLGATHLGSGATLSHNFPLGVHMVTLVVNDGEYSDSDDVQVTVEDRIPPTTTLALSGTMGGGGWYISPVDVSASAVDNFMGSGVKDTFLAIDGGAHALYAGPVTVSGDGSHTANGYSTDNAGNVESPGADASFKIDMTAPDITVNSPVAGSYTLDQDLTIDYAVTDARSGVASEGADLDGTAVAQGQVIELWTLALGSHTFNVAAADVAGNSSAMSVQFDIIVTHQALENLKHKFADMGWIDNQGIVVSLDQKIRAAARAHDRGQYDTEDNILAAFIAEVEAQTDKHIHPTAAQALIAGAQWLMDNN